MTRRFLSSIFRHLYFMVLSQMTKYRVVEEVVETFETVLLTYFTVQHIIQHQCHMWILQVFTRPLLNLHMIVIGDTAHFYLVCFYSHLLQYHGHIIRNSIFYIDIKVQYIFCMWLHI
jgi:hypothetical protein